jgi:hypothetical protein
MTDHIHPSPPSDVLAELVAALLEAGAVLSQIISHMVEFEAAGRSAPSAAPIPEVAHSVIRDALGEIRDEHSKRDVKVASRIVKRATDAICDNVFFVGPELN